MDRDKKQGQEKETKNKKDRDQVETGSVRKPSTEMRPELLQTCTSTGRAGAGPEGGDRGSGWGGGWAGVRY